MWRVEGYLKENDFLGALIWQLHAKVRACEDEDEHVTMDPLNPNRKSCQADHHALAWAELVQSSFRNSRRPGNPIDDPGKHGEREWRNGLPASTHHRPREKRRQRHASTQLRRATLLRYFSGLSPLRYISAASAPECNAIAMPSPVNDGITAA